jgi:aromatic-L-amino-acid decarboxylase
MPEYLRNTASTAGSVIDYRDWQIPLGRRFRSLKLWLVIRWYGADGLAAHIRSGVDLASQSASWIAADPRFELLPHHPLGLVCFRPLWPTLAPEQGDAATLGLMERLNASGQLYLTHTRVGGRVVLRFAVGAPSTELRHVQAAWQYIGDLLETALR